MNAPYTPDLCDEVLVLRGPHAGGVGTVTDVKVDLGFFVEGTRPDGEEFSRWSLASEVTPAEWGTWYTALTMASGDRIVGDEITEDPIAPVEAVANILSEGEWYILDIGMEDGRPVKRAVAIRHIESVEVIVHARRDAR